MRRVSGFGNIRSIKKTKSLQAQGLFVEGTEIRILMQHAPVVDAKGSLVRVW